MRPVVVGRERELIVVVWRVDGAARIAVLEPGAADVGILFEDLKGNAGLLQLDGNADAGDTGADDRYAKVACGIDGLNRLRCPLCAETDSLGDQRQVVSRNLPAGRNTHHAEQLLSRWLGQPWRGAAIEIRERCRHPIANALLDVDR